VEVGEGFEAIEVLVITLEQGGHRAWGEAVGVYYRNDCASMMLSQIEAIRPSIEKGISRDSLQSLLSPVKI